MAGTLKTGLKAAAGAIASVSGALGAGIVAGAKYNASIEEYQTSFEVMTGSAEKAAEVIEKLKKIGAETPFELPELADATQLLMNYGFTADEAIDRMMMLGDIAQGSADKMQRIATAYGQMSSAGKVQLEDIKQMIEAGFNPLQEISESTGESMESLYERISDGAVSVDEITASMERATSAGGKYYQSMEKQSQTVSGLISTLKDNAQQLLGEVLQPISESLRTDLLPSAIDAVDGITEAFRSGGLKSAVKEAGKVVSDFVADLAKKAPDMVDVAVDFIGSFVSELGDHRNDLIKAAGEIAESLANGLVKLLPKEIREPVEDMVDAITDSLSSGGLKRAGRTLAQVFENISDTVGTLAKIVLPPLVKIVETLADNMDGLLPIITGIAGAFLSYQTATKALTIATNAQTAAQTALNLVSNANPYVLLATAIGGLAAGFGVLTTQIFQANDAYTTITEEEQKFIDKVHEEYEAMLQAKEARQEAGEAILTEYGHTQDLWEELQNLVDANGKVKEGYEERAAAITGLLRDALGIEIDMTDGVIQKYDELKQSMDSVIEKKKAQAMLSSYEEDYLKAIENQADAQNTLADRSKKLSDTQRELNEVTKDLEAAQEAAVEDTSWESGEIYNLIKKQKELTEELKANQQAYNEAAATYDDYASTISNYEYLSGALETQADDIELATLKTANSFKTAEIATRESLQQQVQDMADNYQAMQQTADTLGTEAANQAAYEAYLMYAMSQLEYAKLNQIPQDIDKWQKEIQQVIETSQVPEEAKKQARAMTEKYNGEIRSGAKDTKDSVNYLTGETKKALSASGLASSAISVGKNLAYGISDGITEATWAVKNAAVSAIDIALEAAKNKAGIHSPSTLFRDEVGKYLAAGMGVGFENNIPIQEIGSALDGAVNKISDHYAQVGQRINPVDVITGTSRVAQTYQADVRNIFEGMTIVVDNVTNLDGAPIYRKASEYTIRKIGGQQRAVLRAQGVY